MWSQAIAVLCCLANVGSSSADVRIVANEVRPSGQPVHTVAQLQALLDANPNTTFHVSRSRWEIDAAEPQSIWLRDNRTLVMSSDTVIAGAARMPATSSLHAGGGALLTVNGNNITLVGGRFEQDILPACNSSSCNFAIDIYYSSGVTFRDTVTTQRHTET